MPRTTPGNYVPLDVNYARDPDIRAAGPEAEQLFLRSLAYAKGSRSGGRVPEYDLAVVAVGLKNVQRRIAALVTERLWVVVEGGWHIRSWDRWNGDDDSRRAHARRANCKRWHFDRGITDPDCEFCPSPGDSPGESGADPHRNPEWISKGREGKGTEDSLRSPSSDAASPGDSPPEPKPKRGTRLADDFGTTPEMEKWARENCPKVTATPGNGGNETLKFIDYWQAESGQRASKRDWVAAWRLWMRNAEERAGRGIGTTNGQKPSTTDQRVAAGMELARKYAEMDGS